MEGGGGGREVAYEGEEERNCQAHLFPDQATPAPLRRLVGISARLSSSAFPLNQPPRGIGENQDKAGRFCCVLAHVRFFVVSSCPRWKFSYANNSVQLRTTGCISTSTVRHGHNPKAHIYDAQIYIFTLDPAAPVF